MLAFLLPSKVALQLLIDAVRENDRWCSVRRLGPRSSDCDRATGFSFGVGRAASVGADRPETREPPQSLAVRTRRRDDDGRSTVTPASTSDVELRDRELSRRRSGAISDDRNDRGRD